MMWSERQCSRVARCGCGRRRDGFGAAETGRVDGATWKKKATCGGGGGLCRTIWCPGAKWTKNEGRRAGWGCENKKLTTEATGGVVQQAQNDGESMLAGCLVCFAMVFWMVG